MNLWLISRKSIHVLQVKQKRLHNWILQTKHTEFSPKFVIDLSFKQNSGFGFNCSLVKLWKKPKHLPRDYAKQ